jgi:DHA1 family tetracycline resistance protein-like MFS transporter
VRRAAFAFVFITVALDMLALGVIVPVLPKLVLQFEGGDTGNAATIYGLFGTVFAAMQFLFAPLLGALSDRYGRRPLILLSNAALGLDYFVMALAPSLAWLFAGRVIAGICSASFSIPGAYVADVTPPERRAARFGALGAAFGLGFVIGPAFGGFLGAWDPRLPFWVAAVLSLANFLYGLAVLPESLPPARRAAFDWRRANPLGALGALRARPQVIGLAAALFLAAIAHEVQPSLWVLYTDHRYGWDARTVGLTLALVGVMSAFVGAVLTGRAVASFGERPTLLAGTACGTLGFILYGIATSGSVFAAAIPLVGLLGVAGPAAQAIMTSRMRADEQGRLQGALSSLSGVAHMIGPVLFTSVFALALRPDDRLAEGAPFLLAAVFLAASGGLAWRVTWDPRPDPGTWEPDSAATTERGSTEPVSAEPSSEPLRRR